MINAVIFDFDGVIIDSEAYHYQAYKDLFAGIGLDFSWPHEKMAGRKVEDNVRAFLAEKGVEGDVKALAIKKEDIYLAGILENAKAMPGAVGLVKCLKASGRVRLAVGTSSSRRVVDALLERMGLRGYFDFVASSSDVTNAKPAPDVFLLAAKRLGVPASECLVFEDASAGVKAAKAAGMKCVAVRSPFAPNQDYSQADSVVGSLEEIDVGKLFGG